jgi:hypothetical protein
MSVFPARSIRSNPPARISDAKITPCWLACCRKAGSGPSKPSSVPGMPWGMWDDGASAHAAPGANRRAGGDGHHSHMACFVDYKR